MQHFFFFAKRKPVLKEKREDEKEVRREEMGENGCPLKGFAQAFLKLDVVQVHGWAMGKGKKPQKSAEEGRNDINTRFFAEGKKGTFL